MANKTPKTPSFSNEKNQKKRSREILIGGFFILTSLLLFVALVSYFFTWKIDQSDLNDFANRAVSNRNALSKVGAVVSHFFIYKGMGMFH